MFLRLESMRNVWRCLLLVHVLCLEGIQSVNLKSRNLPVLYRVFQAQNRSNAAFLAGSAPPVCHKSRHRVHLGPYSQYPVGGYYYPNVQQSQPVQYRPGGAVYNPWEPYGYTYPAPVATTRQSEAQTAKEIEAAKKQVYFSSFHPFVKRNTHWFLDDSSDDIWPGTNKIKVGETYPAIINYFFTPNCAMIIFLRQKVEACMTLEDLPKEIEAYSLKDIFRPYHVINVTLKQPFAFDAKLRPRVTISREFETIPKLERLQRVFCRPIFMNRFSVVFEIEGETLLGQVFFREMGFRKFDAHDYPMDVFFKNGETVELEVLNTPLYPTRCGYLLRVPIVSTLRDRWCDELPEIADAIKYSGSEYEMPYMHKYNAFVDFSVGSAYAEQHQQRWSSSYPQTRRTQADNYPPRNQAGSMPISYRYNQEHVHPPPSQDEKLESLIRQRNQSQLQDILPSEAKPCTIAAFTKRIGGRLKDVLKYLFIKTKIPIDSSRRLTKNLAKRIYNFVTGREEFGDIDAKEEMLEIQHLQSTKDVDGDRAPVVVLMGHVDHGKTSLFDLLCNCSFAKREAGQITQGIRAAKAAQGNFTLIDTPGHEIFDVMRINGAKTADIAIIVIAGNEGIKEQTRESLRLCKELQVPFIVAVTKCDLPNLCTEEIATDLAAMDILIEPLGGDVQFLNVSSVQDASHCVRTVTEAVNLQYAVTPPAAIDLPENYLAHGFVMESGKDAKNGQYSMLLVKHGSLSVGQFLTCGSTSFKVTQIKDTHGNLVDVAKPSDVVSTFGYEGPALEPGSEFAVLESQEQANVLAEVNLSATKSESTAQALESHVNTNLETFGNSKAQNTTNTAADGQVGLEAVSVPLYIKSDSAGAIDALCKGLKELEAVGMTKKATFTIHKGSSGQVTIGDVMLAATHKGCLLCFNSPVPTAAKNEAKRLSVDVISGNVIYQLLQDACEYLGRRLGEPLVGQIIGTVKVLKVFEAAKRSTAAGGVVSSGKVVAGAKVRLVRNNVVVYAGKLASLRRTKEEAEEIGESESCGMTFENFNDIKPNDIVHVFDPNTLTTTRSSN